MPCEAAVSFRTLNLQADAAISNLVNEPDLSISVRLRMEGTPAENEFPIFHERGPWLHPRLNCL